MKTILLSLFVSAQAFAATQTIDLSVSPIVDGTICKYDTTLSFDHFPDFEVFTSSFDGKIWQKGNATAIRTTVEIDGNKHTLRLQPGLEFLEAGKSCPVKNVKVLVRD